LKWNIRLGEKSNHKFLKFCAKEQDMKGFTPDMLVQQLKEKYKISDILNIKYMGRDKDWIDYKCCDFD
jgi:hypothetical protein